MHAAMLAYTGMLAYAAHVAAALAPVLAPVVAAASCPPASPSRPALPLLWQLPASSASSCGLATSTAFTA